MSLDGNIKVPGDAASQLTGREDQASANESPALTLVAVGASAGGLDALTALVSRVAGGGLTLVVAQHLAAGDSALRAILARNTTVPVVDAVDGLRLDANIIYVSPPQVVPTVHAGVLHLAPAPRLPSRPIDALFQSLAADRGTSAIGVVLSGAGSDGTIGARAIREQGGVVIAQDPATAQYASMPQSVIDDGLSDYCLAPDQIGDELMRLAAHPLPTRGRARRVFSRQALAQVFDRVRAATGVDFQAYKLPTIERRLERRMAFRKFERVEDYLDLLEADGGELKALQSDLLIGVTSFFRDGEPFDALKSTVFPSLIAVRDSELPMRIWVPGCATGEEAYSVAMCLLEALDDTEGRRNHQIFATDLDAAALARARRGLYPQSIEADVSPARLTRFFERQGDGYLISQRLRDMVVFAPHNLAKDPPFSRLDLISCRNVLIYMQPELQNHVLKRFHYALKPDGFLLLGSSESAADAPLLFATLDSKVKLYTKKSARSPGVFAFPSTSSEVRRRVDAGTGGQRAGRRVLAPELADRAVLERFGPPGMLVDNKLEVVQFRGAVGPFLAPSEGTATLNVLKLVRPELLFELKRTLQRAASEAAPVSTPPIALQGQAGDVTLILHVTPLQADSRGATCTLVLFQVVEVAGASALADDEPRHAEHEPISSALARELLVTKEYLQTTVHELESANEELQSTNEELQSSNEELQSINEELETSRDELQSAKEELETLNDELQNRIAEGGVTKADLHNLLASLSEPFLLVDADLRIRKFSRAAEELLNLLPRDAGRSVEFLEGALAVPDFPQLVADTIQTQQDRSRRVRCPDEEWYTLHITPYRSVQPKIQGALVELTRANRPRTGYPRDVRDLAGSVLSTLPQVLMLLDERLRLVWVNQAFCDSFGRGAEVLGWPLEEIWPSRQAQPALWDALEEATSRGTGFVDIVITHPFGRESDRAMKFSARGLVREDDESALTLVLMEELS